MPRIEYFVVSESISNDQNTNNVSIFHICEEFSGRLPITLSRLVATSCWSIEPADKGKDFQVALRVLLPGGALMPELRDLKVNFTTDRARHRVFQYIHGLRVEHPGDLVIEVLLDGVACASHTISVHDRDAE
jgi:hypothetical protein